MVTPTRLPDLQTIFYQSRASFPAPRPWDVTYGGTVPPFLTAFQGMGAENKAAVLDNRQVKNTATVYDVYFYALQNSTFLRYKSRVTYPVDVTGWKILPVIYDWKTGFLITGAVNQQGDNKSVSAYIFSSVAPYAMDSGDKSEVAMSLIYSGTFDPSFYADDHFNAGANQSISLANFPVGGVLTWGIAVNYTAHAPRPGGQADWGYTTVFQPIEAVSYPIYSSWNFSTGIVIGAPLFALSSATEFFNGAYVSFIDADNVWTFSTSNGTTPVSLNCSKLTLNMSLGDKFNLGDSFNKWIGDDGKFYCGTKTFAYQFAVDFTSYRQLTYIGGDKASQDFLANEPINVSSIWGYSGDSDALLLSNSDATNPLILSNFLAYPRGMGRGPIWPMLSLPCQSYCIPMFRSKKI